MRLTKAIFGALLAAFAPAPNAQETTIRTNVNLVQLNATVTDSKGRAVSGLGKDAFQLYVDNTPQSITVFQGEDAPVTAGIVIDNSASMAPKREEVIAAALAFARASNPKDQIFVVHFSDHPRLGLPEGMRFTGDISELEKAIAAFDFGGTTAIYDALTMAESQFRWAGYSRKVLLLITDGGDNSSHASLADSLNGAVKGGIAVYCIGIFDKSDRDRKPEVLSRIAEETAGQAFFSDQGADVTKSCISIAREIRNQYTLGFPGAEDGQYHSIRVTANDSKYGPLEVHTRTGYFAVKSAQAGS